jgi:uncharacterized membrane protein
MSTHIKISKYRILIILFIISFAASTALSVIPLPEICDPGKGCDVVQTSKYATLFGIKNSIYGMGVFALLITLSYFQLKRFNRNRDKIINYSIIIGTVIALWFIYLQAIVLEAWCKYCMVADIAVIFAFLVIVFWKKG